MQCYTGDSTEIFKNQSIHQTWSIWSSLYWCFARQLSWNIQTFRSTFPVYSLFLHLSNVVRKFPGYLAALFVDERRAWIQFSVTTRVSFRCFSKKIYSYYSYL